MTAEILCIGTELLLGNITNGNARWIAEQLAALGIPHHRQTVVGDNRERLIAAVREAAGRCRLLITTGGLGPTPDDLTTEAIAAAFDTPLSERPEVWADIEAKAGDERTHCQRVHVGHLNRSAEARHHGVFDCGPHACAVGPGEPCIQPRKLVRGQQAGSTETLLAHTAHFVKGRIHRLLLVPARLRGTGLDRRCRDHHDLVERLLVQLRAIGKVPRCIKNSP